MCTVSCILYNYYYNEEKNLLKLKFESDFVAMCNVYY